MTRALWLLLAVAFTPGLVHAATCSDPAAADAVRRQVQVDCACALSPTRGTFLRCATQQLSAAVDAGTLPADCFGAAKRCVARSTCGKPGAVTCCRTSASGVTKCSPKRDAATCRPPRGGSACVGIFASCCDACDAGGCTETTSTTSTSTTSTTIPTATEGCCVGDFSSQPNGIPPGTCAFEAFGPPVGVAIFARTCADVGAAATWTEARCAEPLCGPAAGCCANVSSFAGTSIGFFGNIPDDGGAGAAACTQIGGTPLVGPCP